METNSRLQTLGRNWTKRDTYVSVLYLGILLLLARYLLSPSFGFYEDDYTLVVRGMASSWGETWTFIRNLLLTFGGQGRPLQHSLLFFISRIVGQLGGLHLGYLVAFVIVLLNCSLFYLLVRKLVGHEFALLAATFYTLYSADTTQAFLYHAFGLQQSLTFFLLAGLAFSSRKQALAYLLILGSLLSYENTYFVFLTFPLLCYRWDKKLLRRMAEHGLLLIIIFLLVAALRLVTGESRVSSLSWPSIVITPLLHMVQGPIAALGTNFIRPYQALRSMDLAVYALGVFAFVVFFWLAVRSLRRKVALQNIIDSAARMDGRNMIRNRRLSFPFKIREEQAIYIKILIVGFLMIALAYPLTFTVRAYAISGRDTRVHFAAIFGSALFWASTWEILLSTFHTWTGRKITAVLLSLNLSLLLGFGFLVQKDYAEAWKLQQRLWTSILERAPDLEEGTTIFIDPDGLEDTQFIDANTWALPRVLPYILDFPDSFEHIPAAYRLLPDWRDRLLFNDQEIKVVDYMWNYITSRWKETVIFETEHNLVSNRLSTIQVDGQSYSLKVAETDQTLFKCGYLYNLLITPKENRTPLCR